MHYDLKMNHDAHKVMELLLLNLEAEALYRSKYNGDIEKNCENDPVLLNEFNVFSQFHHTCKKGHKWSDPKVKDLYV